MELCRRALVGAALAAPALLPARGFAQTAVGRPARIILGFAAGGSTDLVARLLADQLRGRYAPAVVVENRTGAAGRLAMEAVRAGDPDGTIMVQTPASVATVQPNLFPNETRFDIFADFAPVTTVATFPYVLSAGPAAPGVTDFASFLAEARRAGGFSYGTPGTATGPHLTGIQLQLGTGLELTHVPYRGGAQSIADLVGGQIPISMNVLSEALPHAEAGRIRILAVSSPQRSPRLPNVPTFAELGLPGATREDWFGVLLPARTPRPIVEALNAALGAALQVPEVRERMSSLELTPTHESPEAFAARIRRDYDSVAALVREGRLTAV
ncbi:MAG: tripartite tricarboxylate transporter substrate binding protein [Acetobacteraceae bacterium]|nr:tripartite tricarboxylate transporter substrate binding protein [Acetobacteraceae bacterium]